MVGLFFRRLRRGMRMASRPKSTCLERIETKQKSHDGGSKPLAKRAVVALTDGGDAVRGVAHTSSLVLASWRVDAPIACSSGNRLGLTKKGYSHFRTSDWCLARSSTMLLLRA